MALDSKTSDSRNETMKRPLRPSPLSRTMTLIPPAVVLVAQHASAAFDAYIKIGDIKGEVTDKGHFEWVHLESIEWNIKRSVGIFAGRRESSPPQVSELVITKPMDRSSPKLFLNAVGGSQEIDTVTIRLVETTNQTVFYELTLSDVLVSSLKQSAITDSDRIPTESVSFNFLKIEMIYTRLDPKTGQGIAETPVGYDLSAAKSF